MNDTKEESKNEFSGAIYGHGCNNTTKPLNELLDKSRINELILIEEIKINVEDKIKFKPEF
nr:MAG TPA: hypothetical protein [Caudoviricetes sp.]